MALTTVPVSLSATALTLTTAAQPNITSVGTLTGLTVSGNIAGTLTTAAQTNITSLGTLTSLTSGAHLINASSSAFGGNSVQGFNTDFLVDTGQGYSRHNSYHTGGSNHQFLVNATGSTTNTVALSINKDANATFAGTISVGSTNVFNNSGVLQSAALSGTYSNALNFSNSSLELSGHMFFNEFSSGRHYIHFKTAASTNQIDWRIQTNSANNTIHSWTNTLASFATPIAVPVGSASAPSLTFSGDTNTGIYRTSSDQIGFAAAGTNQATFLTNRYMFGTTVTGVYYNASNAYVPTMLVKSSHSGELATLALINGDNAYGGAIDFCHITSNNSVQQRFASIVGVSDNLVSTAGSGYLSFRTRATGSATNVTEHMRITAGGTVSIGGVAAPFSKFQVGSHTFSGGNGMYANSRVGMSNHGTLTGLMLASTYNDAAHPEYGLVFVQGPSTSSYNAWSISPDGPAKGNRLNFHYGAQATNIHSPGYRKASLDGSGNFYPVGNVVMPSGQGIDFSATGGPTHTGTGSSELLDDYEEGTFTPYPESYNGNSVTFSGSFYGWYVKIGAKVTVMYKGDNFSFTSGSGGDLVGFRLPFNPTSGQSEGMGNIITTTWAAGGRHLGTLLLSTTNALVGQIGSNNNNGSWAWMDFNTVGSGNTSFRAIFTYFVTS